MKLFNFTINTSALQEIVKFFAENHKKGVGCFGRRMTVTEPISETPTPLPLDAGLNAEENRIDKE